MRVSTPTENYRRRILEDGKDIMERCWIVMEDGDAVLDWRPIQTIDQEGNDVPSHP